MSGLARAIARALTRDNAASTNALVRNLGGGGGNTQAVVMDSTGGLGTAVISNGGLTVTFTGANYGFAIPDASSNRDNTAGGKFIFEVTVDAASSSYFLALGFYNVDEGVSFATGGNPEGIGSLLNATLSRHYHGPTINDYTNATTHIATVATSVITLAVDFDTDQMTTYVDGVTQGSSAVVRDTPAGNNYRPVIKAYGPMTISINPTILHPVDGYEVWG